MNLKRLKRMFHYSKKRNYLYIFLSILLLSVGVGYSYLNTTLVVNGVSNVQKSNWDIHVDTESFHVVDGSVEPLEEPTIDGTNISFSAKLDNPGDFYSFTIDIVNNGTMNATLENFTLTPVLNEDVSKYLTFTVTYDDDTPLSSGDALNKNSNRKIKVLARYNDNLDVDDYPIIDESYDFNIQLDYVQS